MLLYTWIIPHTDDFGRLTGCPAKVSALVVPMTHKSECDVEESLGRLHEAELIQWYEVEGDKYIQVLNFEKYQQGLHKRTKSNYPEPPSVSGKPREFPSEGKRREQKGIGREEEEKGTEREMPSPDSILHRERLHALINQCEVHDYNLHHLDIIFSYIGVIDIEVIEVAIKKSSKKHGQYMVNTLEGMVKRDGITKKEQVLPKQKVGEGDAKKLEGQLQHERAAAKDKPVTGGAVGWLPSKARSSDSKVVQLPQVSG